MSLLSRSFFVHKGETLDQLASFLEREIGFDAYLIKDLQATAINELVTEVTVLYKKYDDDILASVAPREGGIFTSEVTVGGNFEARLLFNQPVDFDTFTNGAIIADGVEVPSSDYYLDPNSNNYFVKVNLNNFTSAQFHDFRINNQKVKRFDGSTFPYSYVAGYVIHTQSSAHLGDRSQGLKLRGKIKADIIRIKKSFSPQQSISEFLSNKDISPEFLISYVTASRGEGSVEVYILYIDNPEPQVIQGFPLTQSLFPEVAAPQYITLVFSTKLDASQLKSQDGLFTVEADFINSNAVSSAHVDVLPDGKTVRIDTTTYFTDQRIYSIIARPGILSEKGFRKVKPDQWVIHVNKYAGGVGSFTGTGAPPDAEYLVASSNPTLTNERVISVSTGISGYVQGSSYVIRGIPGSPTQLGVVSLQGPFFTGTGTISLNESAISHSNLADLSTDAHTQYIRVDGTRAFTAPIAGVTPTLPGHLVTLGYVTDYVLTGITGVTGASINSPYVVWSNTPNLPNSLVITGQSGIETRTGNGEISITWPFLSAYTGHTGTTGIHFTQSQIAIPSTQITDFTNAAQDAAAAIFRYTTGVTGTYNTSSNQLTLAGVVASTSNYGVVTVEAGGALTVTNGTLSVNPALIDHTDLQNVGTYLHDDIDFHIDDTNNPHNVTASQVGAVPTATFTGHTGNTGIHFTVGSINHNLIQNVGTNTHAQIDSHIANTSNPHSVTASQVGAVEIATFTGHTGNTGIHFTVSSINHTLIQNVGTNTHAQIDSHIASTSNPHNVTATQVGAVPTATFTGHTGNTGIHFTQSEISIPTSQIIDFTNQVQDIVGSTFSFGTGISGSYNSSSNVFSVVGRYATYSDFGVAAFDAARFTVSNGFVSLNNAGVVVTDEELGPGDIGSVLVYNGSNYVTMALTGVSGYNDCCSGLSGLIESHNHYVAYSGLPPSGYQKEGNLWLDTSTSRLYLWYVDPDSSQWIEIWGPQI